MKEHLIIAAVSILIISCGGAGNDPKQADTISDITSEAEAPATCDGSGASADDSHYIYEEPADDYASDDETPPPAEEPAPDPTEEPMPTTPSDDFQTACDDFCSTMNDCAIPPTELRTCECVVEMANRC